MHKKAAIDKITALEPEIAATTESVGRTASTELAGSNGTYNFKLLDHSRSTNTK